MGIPRKNSQKWCDILWSYSSFKSVGINLKIDKMKNKMRQNSETDLGKYGNSVCGEVVNQ